MQRFYIDMKCLHPQIIRRKFNVLAIQVSKEILIFLVFVKANSWLHLLLYRFFWHGLLINSVVYLGVTEGIVWHVHLITYFAVTCA